MYLREATLDGLAIFVEDSSTDRAAWNQVHREWPRGFAPLYLDILGDSAESRLRIILVLDDEPILTSRKIGDGERSTGIRRG